MVIIRAQPTTFPPQKKKKKKKKNTPTHKNHATEDNSDMHHLMPQWRLPEWREEDA